MLICRASFLRPGHIFRKDGHNSWIGKMIILMYCNIHHCSVIMILSLLLW